MKNKEGYRMGKEIVSKGKTSASKLAQVSKDLVGVITSYHMDSVKDLKKLDTKFVVTVAKSIMDMTDKIAKGAEFNKQYELGKMEIKVYHLVLFNT